MPVSEIQEVLMKYKKEEDIIDSKIKQTNEVDNQIMEEKDTNTFQNVLNITSSQQAKERNRLILKNLETAKGNLRSKAIFSPSEIQWKEICAKYQSEPTLVANKWKCHLPVFV